MKKALLTLLMVMSSGPAEGIAFRFVDIGDPYPPFCAKQFNGKKVCSDKYTDKLLVISFFTPNQSDSQKTLIDLQDVYTKYKRKDVSVVGIISGKVDLQALDDFVKLNEISFPILLDPDRQVYGSFGVFVYPSTGIFTRDKRLRYYLPARRVNLGKHVEGYIRFLLREISEAELEKILLPSTDKMDLNYRRAENNHNFAKIYFDQGKLDKAKKLLESSIKTHEKYAPAYSLYGYIHIQEKEFRLGLEKFEMALGIDPNLQEAKSGKQICLDNLGQ